MITQDNAQNIFDEGRSISSLRQKSRWYSHEPTPPVMETELRLVFNTSSTIASTAGCDPLWVDELLSFLVYTKDVEKLSLLSNEIEILVTRAILTIPELSEQISEKYARLKKRNTDNMEQYKLNVENYKKSKELSKTLDDRANFVIEQYALMCENIEAKIDSLPFSIFKLDSFEQKIVRGMGICVKNVNLHEDNIIEFDIGYIRERKISYETVINLLKIAGVVS